MRLIDADALKKQMCDECFGGYCGNSCYEWNLMNDAPTVDAVEVVRCKDCKYCSVDRHADGNAPNYVCIEMDCGVEADGFCSWGERKDDSK